MYDIEDSVPMPPPATKGGRPSAYPFAKLGVNQSFFVPYDDLDDESIRRVKARVRRALTTANRAHKNDPKKPHYSARATDTGVRVWRVA